MDLRYFIAMAAAKLSIVACRIFRRSGTTLSGKIACKIDPLALKKLAKGFRIIMVTGTNGKTTTTKMISEILRENKVAYITNKSGANLVSGIASVFIASAGIFKKEKVSTALLEVDEATLNRVTDQIRPDVLVVTNFFRDQLDRYGELLTVVDKVKSGVAKSPNARLVINADDSLCAYIGKSCPNRKIYYGIESGAVETDSDAAVETASHCVFCKSPYEYAYHVYDHLGGFICGNCGFKRPETQVRCIKVDELAKTGSHVHLQAGGNQFSIQINLPGLYNVYNAVAAISCGLALGFEIESIKRAFTGLENCFGRMETIHTDGKNMKIILAKNPAGLNQVLDYLCLEDGGINAAFLLNDRIADGRDVSWIWDTDFEKLHDRAESFTNAFASGVRAEEMAVRLKYAGVPASKIQVEKEYEKLVERGLSATLPGRTFYIITTYTAMMDLRRMLTKRYHLKEFWQ